MWSLLITYLASQLLQSALVFLDLPLEVLLLVVLVVAAASEPAATVAVTERRFKIVIGQIRVGE